MQTLEEVTLKSIASIEGKEGIFRIIKVGNTNLIVEALHSSKKKMIIDGKKQISILNEIDIYDQSKEGKKALGDVFQLIAKHCDGNECQVDTTSSKDLVNLFDIIFPTYDRKKVYPSNLKKIVRWYNLLLAHYPHTVKIKKDIVQESTAEKELSQKVKEKSDYNEEVNKNPSTKDN